MTTEGYLLAVLAVFVLHGGILHVGHTVVLRRFYERAAPALLEAEEAARLRLLHISGNAIFAFFFVLVFSGFGGASMDSGLLAGLGAGLAIGVLVYVPQALMFLGLYGLPPALLIGGMLTGLSASAAGGVAAALVL